MLRIALFAAVLAIAAGSAPPSDATPLELDESLAQSVTCAVGSYYWGEYNSKHYCVRCPDGKTSDGCTNCVADPQAATCVAATLCARGRYLSGSTCTDCVEGKWQSQEGKSECYDCPKGMFQLKKAMHSCYWCPVGQFQNEEGAHKCQESGLVWSRGWPAHKSRISKETC